MSKEGSRPGRRAFPYVLVYVRWLCGIRSRQNLEQFRFFGGGGGQQRSHFPPPPEQTLFEHPPEASMSCAVESTVLWSRARVIGVLSVGQVVASKLIHYTPAVVMALLCRRQRGGAPPKHAPRIPPQPPWHSLRTRGVRVFCLLLPLAALSNIQGRLLARDHGGPWAHHTRHTPRRQQSSSSQRADSPWQ